MKSTQQEKIKVAIVDAYRRGVCNHEGGTIPKERRGMAGKGSHFIGRKTPEEQRRFRDNYDLIDWGH